MNIGLFFRTLRTLRPEQVYYRLLYAVRGRLKQPAGALVSAGAVPAPTRLAAAQPFPAYPWFDAASVRAGRFRFLNVSAVYGPHPEWNDIHKSRLWRYNLHYFNWLLPPGGLTAETGLRLMRSWMQGNPPGAADAWDPFPTSLRIVNWIKYLSLHPERLAGIPDILDSLYRQTLWLEKSIEYHLLANHLLKNAKALLFAGLFFDGPDATRCLETALRLLRREIAEQILPDGGHFERSPMYHSMILEDCLDLYNVCEGHGDAGVRAFAGLLPEFIERMVSFLRGMCHPDGQIALFNDATLGIELPPADLLACYARLLDRAPCAELSEVVSFPATGYYVMSPSAGNRLIVDCGEVGPDYQPGHAHCDALSFEMSLGGRRVIVDSGCAQYEDGPIRQYNRGNRGHNTVTVDGQNQSEVWGAHRCGRRARPIRARLEKTADGTLSFTGAHDGYARLLSRTIHSRRISWWSDICIVEDRIHGRGSHDIESRLHIHPDLNVEQTDSHIKISGEGREILCVQPLSYSRIEIEEGWYCPEFGKQLKCNVLVQRHRAASLPFRLGWKLSIAAPSAEHP